MRDRAGGLVHLLIPLAAAACAQGGGVGVRIPVPSAVVAESSTIQHTVPERVGQIPVAALDSLGPRIRSLRADPTDLVQLEGDTVRVANVVRVLALDSAGVVLGELRTYDFGYRGRGFRLLHDGGVHLRRRGTLRFTARLPRRFWNGDEARRPSVDVPIRVESR